MFATRPDAVEVSPGLLIGSAPGRRQRRALAKRGLDLVVDLRDEGVDRANEWPETIEVTRLPLADSGPTDIGILRSLATWIVERISVGQRVLVHCQADIGRCATVTCAVLIEMGWSLADACRRLSECRTLLAPTATQVRLLVEFERVFAHNREPSSSA